jgi:hypothetical protein
VALVPAWWWRYAWLTLTWLAWRRPATVLIVLGLAGLALVGALRWRSTRRASRGQRRAEPIAVRLPMLVHVLLLLVLATAVVSVVGLGLWWVLGRPGTGAVGGWSTQDTFDALKIALSVVAGVGAVVALTVAYRKQVLSEAAEYREDTKLFTERFTTAAGQLGADQAAVRLAGRPSSSSSCPAAKRCRTAAFNSSSSASSWADPMCSMSCDPRRDEYTICTTYGDTSHPTSPGLVRRLPRYQKTNLRSTTVHQLKIRDLVLSRV